MLPKRLGVGKRKFAPLRLSAARQSAQLGRNAFTSPRSFGCGCAALRNMQARHLRSGMTCSLKISRRWIQAWS